MDFLKCKFYTLHNKQATLKGFFKLNPWTKMMNIWSNYSGTALSLKASER